jgi:hypothetical protein
MDFTNLELIKFKSTDSLSCHGVRLSMQGRTLLNPENQTTNRAPK